MECAFMPCTQIIKNISGISDLAKEFGFAE
jgi:hypothetical protein